MFKYSEDTRLYWFNGNTFETNLKFELIGILMGIAIYNQVILDLHFPRACYKKLLNLQPNLQDLYEYMPEVAQSLEFILNTDEPDLENLLYQNFTVEVDVYGSTQVYELVPDGAELYVNQDNKNMYVEMLIDFIFNTHCEA